jgi:membrane associated rhomboid family serine protease
MTDLTPEEKKALLQASAASQNSNTEPEITNTQKFLALFGLPAESNPDQLESFPIATVVLIVFTFVASVLCFFDPNLFEALAFYPSSPLKNLGLGFLTCFFVHGGWLHLLTNMYCLFVFGDNVEDVLGIRKYLYLLAVATFVGSFLSFLASEPAPIPHVGASGGIFGVMIFYLLRFPKVKFTYLFLFRFVHVPASVVLIFYVATQLYGSATQLAGQGEVDYLAHVGGGLTGLVFWYTTGKTPKEQNEKDSWV